MSKPPEDHFTNTPQDAAAYEQYRAGDDDELRPTKAELDRDDDDQECLHLHQDDIADLEADPMAQAVWVCSGCGKVCDL